MLSRRFRRQIRKPRLAPRRARPLRIEPLDDRRMLAVLTVNTHVDPFAIFSDGTISLREAIEAANTNAPAGDAPAGDPGHDVIRFDPSMSGESITLSVTQLLITESVTIDASALPDGITIDADNRSRHFTIAAVDTTLRGLTLVNGRAAEGGAIFVGGELFLEESTLSGNVALLNGGGISLDGGSRVTIANSALSDNEADGNGGGVHLPFTGAVTVTNSILSGNTANGSGGGIANGGTVTMTNSTLSGNGADRHGGGIRNSGMVTITDSGVTGNSAIQGGGGLSNDSAATITDTTVAGNSARYGGGIHFNGVGLSTMTGSTVSGNSANFNGGGILNSGLTYITASTIVGNSASRGGAVFNRSTALTMTGNIMANSQGVADLDILNAASSFDGDYNLVGDGSRLSDFTHSIQGDPLLDPLAENGGPTMTHLPAANSPVIDAGDPAAMAGVGATPEFDQRGIGFSRVVGGRIDLGAVERLRADIDPDFNGDGFINVTDIDLLQANLAVGPADPSTFDLDGDGAVTIADR
ncbi:MAG: choice-of-anchor Q domain-containing protein, partial [Planctomycetota bacterium]